MPGCSVASKREQEDWLFQLLCGYGVCGGCQPLAGVCGLLFSRQLLPAERAAAHQHLMSCRGCQGARGKRRQHINLLCTGLTARATDIPCSEHEHHSLQVLWATALVPEPRNLISSHLISWTQARGRTTNTAGWLQQHRLKGHWIGLGVVLGVGLGNARLGNLTCSARLQPFHSCHPPR